MSHANATIPAQPAAWRHLSSPRSRAGAVLLGVMLLVGSCLVQLTALHSTPAAADEPTRQPPLPGEVLRGFQVGEHDWEPGHRGVDLAGPVGAPVRAAAAGVVSWVGTIAGVPMLSVQHPDGVRTTYQPLSASVVKGQQVGTGQQLGVLTGGHCDPGACLHWGVREGERYLDPLLWLSAGATVRVRLLPQSVTPRQLPPPGEFEDAEAGVPANGSLPATGPVTSRFGGRVNPISGRAEFHDGVDVGAACGTPVQVLWPGVVTSVGVAGGYGLRVEVSHGDGRGSSYSHLSGFAAAPGQQVAAGTTIGLVGTTGFSTGCHLHYSVTQGGVPVDPLARA